MKKMRYESGARRLLCVILSAVMIFTAMPVFALSGSGSAREHGMITEYANGAVTPSKVNDAIAKFSDSLSKFVADTSKLSEVSAALIRFGGITSAASGVIGFLQMLGIIKDPTYSRMEQILNEVKNIEDKLEQMDVKIDRIQKDLIDIAVAQEEKDRANKALLMNNNWEKFNTDYSEPLDDRMSEYQGKINTGIRDWWRQRTHDGIYVNFTPVKKKVDGEELDDLELTYSSEPYSSGIPAVADNGEPIEREYSIGVPSEYMPDTRSMRFNIGSYQSDFKAAMTESFIRAADAHALDTSDEVYSIWDDMKDHHKREFAGYYGEYILNTQIYHIACEVMSDNDAWVIEVINDYKHYCDHILTKDSGIDAMLNAMYLTHGFEGEIKDDVSDFCDAMVVKTGVYGQFVLACAGQDELQSMSNKQELQDYYTDTIIALHDKKQYALTGHDNFCYVTGTVMEFDQATISSHMEFTHTRDCYKESYIKGAWKLTSENYLNDVYSQVLYHQYQALDQGTNSFVSYLAKYGTGIPSDYSGKIMTQWNGGVDFALNEGIMMNMGYGMGKYFWTGNTYRINVGNPGKIENKYFVIHDKAMYDVMDMKDEALIFNQMAGARALYGENHKGWIVDENADFYTSNLKRERSYANNQDKVDLSMTADILKLKPLKDMNGEGTEDDPFYSFDSPVLTGGVSDVTGPVGDDKNSLTGLKLKSNSFTYTGKAIEPGVTAVSERKKLAGGGYEITYSNNLNVGNAVVTVTGLGNYAGTVTRQFKIVPKGTKIKKVKGGKAAAAVSWKKQTAVMSSDHISGYQIRYSTGSSMKNAKIVTVKGYKKSGKRITGLRKNRRYWFQVRTYMTDGRDTFCSVWSAKKAVKTK